MKLKRRDFKNLYNRYLLKILLWIQDVHWIKSQFWVLLHILCALGFRALKSFVWSATFFVYKRWNVFGQLVHSVNAEIHFGHGTNTTNLKWHFCSLSIHLSPSLFSSFFCCVFIFRHQKHHNIGSSDDNAAITTTTILRGLVLGRLCDRSTDRRHFTSSYNGACLHLFLFQPAGKSIGVQLS